MNEQEIRNEINRIDSWARLIGYSSSAFIAGIVASNNTLDLRNIFFTMEINPNYLSISAGFISVLLGIAIPVSLTVITNIDNKYNQTEIIKEFVQERIYEAQYFFLFANVALLAATTFFDIKNMAIYAALLGFFGVSIILFGLFIRLIHKYTAHLADHLRKKYLKEIDAYFE